MAEPETTNRPMTPEQRRLVQWMLEHSEDAEAKSFLPQLVEARVTPWSCKCGCASFNLMLNGHRDPTGGIRPIADFLFGGQADLSGIFVYEQEGALAGVEVYGLAADAPKNLPAPEALRPFRTGPVA